MTACKNSFFIMMFLTDEYFTTKVEIDLICLVMELIQVNEEGSTFRKGETFPDCQTILKILLTFYCKKGIAQTGATPFNKNPPSLLFTFRENDGYASRKF